IYLFLVSLTIWLVSLPLILERVHLVTPVAILVNPLLWIPLTFALINGFATIIFAWVSPPLAILSGYLASYGFSLLQGLLDFFHSIPGGHFWFPAPSKWWLLGFYVPIAFFTLFPQLSPRKKYLLIGLAIWCLIGWCSGYVRDWERNFSNRLEVRVLSVGHGSSILIVTPDGKVVVYDSGSFSKPGIGVNALSASLWNLGKTKIDALFISHPDTDHYNAVFELANRFRFGKVYVSPFFLKKGGKELTDLKTLLEKNGIKIVVVEAGSEPQLSSRTNFSVLHPEFGKQSEDNAYKYEYKADKAEKAQETDYFSVNPNSVAFDAETSGIFYDNFNSNSTSLVLLVEHESKRILFTGDIETNKMSVPVLFLDNEPIKCDVMLVPHHGGNSNLTEPLLKWANPNTVIISGGKFTYKPSFVEALKIRGFEVYHTLTDGCVQIRVQGNGIQVSGNCKKN
ncbi:MAG: ComEC/Rec2 family competence protein, partial [Thermoguttaceae bacterium]